MHHSGCSHIMVSPDGGAVYAATRTDGRIAQFAVGAEGSSFTQSGCSHDESFRPCVSH
jgi:6-phosphogluconolactonase (cycloisomerase 2 family)